MKKNKGITLIALIITIIILIILTAVTINNVIGTDLIGFATKAVENYTDAARDEADKVDKLVGTLTNQGVGEDSKVRAGQIVEKTEKDNYTDVQGRHATIPQGFKVSTKSSEQYIKDGLVIQDAEGNEFVWVPCYYGAKPEETLEDVQEYKKHEYIGTSDTNGSVKDPNGNWETHMYTSYKDNWFDEAVEKRDEKTGEITEDENAYGNASVKKYGGFYIGRYEAGFPDYDTSKFSGDTAPYFDGDDINYSKELEKKNITTKKPLTKANVFAWNYITQQNAKKVSELMYSDNSSVDSKLIDGTAWDTMTTWIASSGIVVTNTANYGNYFITNKPYTGWYAEHVWSQQQEGQTGGTIFGLWAKNFTFGNIQLIYHHFTEEEWQAKKDNYTNVNGNDTIKNSLDTRIEIPTGSYEDFKLKNVYDLAGNMMEYTTEEDYERGEISQKDIPAYAVARGGAFFWSDGFNEGLWSRWKPYL